MTLADLPARDLLAKIILAMSGDEWVYQGKLQDVPEDHPALLAIATYRQAAMMAGAEAMREAAAATCNKRGCDEEGDWGLTRAAQSYYRARNAVRHIDIAEVVRESGGGG